ncbi:MAG: phosphoribosylformylglycinamidine synthase subunit PurL [candidate division KSB1 bacterium]|nr:phosphoribosylformylglycinamidine synthase subunit PurL [candidate division KSB1 bacterium]MDZ7303226.1 phosphoribosylformylglycinamidine synthase subunit PurL [candidate division KSB1 bacterium]MDZ7312162.1 phosphoribosylformylglycinamidine synthase subunit PurL [candidate division KSB1 bacterium]
MPEPQVTLDLALQHGLSEEEYNRILEILGRVPTFTELGIFSVMWSEHCSYKNSLALIKTLPREGKHLLVKAGEENAGLVDIGDGLAIAFKIESHNHPSAVEPYQGAATGVGGILRDIFTMGARPIAALNSLRFGDLENARTRYLVKGVVKGIGDYGNCFGVPTVAGEVYFDDCYQDNPLVNAMAVGIVRHQRVARAVAKGEGNAVILIGSSTGRDGIHGATFASEEISEKSESRRPQVQVGDPFTEKVLLEASLEMIKADLIIGMQDMGAAGITCSTSEMSARGKHGMDIDLEKVPLREPGMIPYEIMLSESQERMLVVAKPGKENEIEAICQKWDLHAAIIGRVTSGNTLRVRMNGKVVAEIPADSLVVGGGAPVYIREAKEPEYLKTTRAFDPTTLPETKNLKEVLLKLLSSPNIASKQWVYQQYDHTVRSNTVIAPGGDAAVLRIKGTGKGIALKTDCNGRYVYLNPRRGAAIAVAEAARNVVVSGAQPVAITNCLNFGNPYKPEIYWQFKEAIAGIGEACRALETPVTGGNVSFYNESPDRAVYPTPVIGMLGILEDIRHATTAYFKNEGDEIALLGTNLEEVGGSEFLKVIHGKVAGDGPAIDLQKEKAVHAACLEAIQLHLINSAHDIAEGGLAVALAECCIINQERPIGAIIDLFSFHRADFALFGESQSLIIISYSPANHSAIAQICQKHRVPFAVLGRTGGTTLKIPKLMEVSLAEMAERYYFVIEQMMERI